MARFSRPCFDVGKQSLPSEDHMKNLKLAILAFAALGLALEISEFESFKAMLTHPFAGSATGLIMIGGFVLPLVMGIMGMTKPPFMMWQALASLAGLPAGPGQRENLGAVFPISGIELASDLGP